MNFYEYDAAVMRTAGPATTRHDALALSALGLAGESGEFADMIKKHLYHGHPLSMEKYVEELGDILWYLSRACDAVVISLHDVAEANIAKLQLRYPEGFSTERSINRGDT